MSKGLPKKFQEYFKIVGCLKGAFRVFLWEFLGYFKEIQKVFEGNSIGFSTMFQENFRVVLRKIGKCFPGAYRLFPRSLKVVSRNFKGVPRKRTYIRSILLASYLATNYSSCA